MRPEGTAFKAAAPGPVGPARGGRPARPGAWQSRRLAAPRIAAQRRRTAARGGARRRAASASGGSRGGPWERREAAAGGRSFGAGVAGARTPRRPSSLPQQFGAGSCQDPSQVLEPGPGAGPPGVGPPAGGPLRLAVPAGAGERGLGVKGGCGGGKEISGRG